MPAITLLMSFLNRKIRRVDIADMAMEVCQYDSPFIKDATRIDTLIKKDRQRQSRIKGIFLRKHAYKENIKFANNQDVDSRLGLMRCAIDTVHLLCREKHFTFEPFQDEMFKAIMLSRLRHFFGDEAKKYVVPVMKMLNMVDEHFDEQTCDRISLLRLQKKIEEYDQKFVVVMVPRRSGKNATAQIIATSLLLHEPAAAIMIWAQDMNCALLNKENIAENLALLKARTHMSFDFRISGDTVSVIRSDASRSIMRVKPNSPNVSMYSFIYIYIYIYRQIIAPQTQYMQLRNDIQHCWYLDMMTMSSHPNPSRAKG